MDLSFLDFKGDTILPKPDKKPTISEEPVKPVKEGNNMQL